MTSERQEPGRSEASGEARAPGPHPARQRPRGPPGAGAQREGRPPVPPTAESPDLPAGLGEGEGNGGRGAGGAPRLGFQVSVLHNRVGLGGPTSLPTCAVSGVSPPAF